MSQSDIFAVTKTADGSVFGSRARVRQVQVHTAGSGSPAITLKDGGSGGTTRLTMTLTTGVVHSVNLPDNGILFSTDVFLDLTDCTGVTVFLS
jgi:hypothetical protein|tara:strand:+ start:311 stop:589 length:279 start_codon:yes stop_codon:yes gene_type:complete